MRASTVSTLAAGIIAGFLVEIMRASTEFRVRRAHWESDRTMLTAVRRAVFVVEQRVPPDLEWDGLDPSCEHVIALAGAQPIGTGRLLPDGHIGRMAVAPAWRRKGVGSALLNELLSMASERGMRRVMLHAQTQAKAFYQHHGFRVEGEEFMEAGIPHIKMVRDLA